MRSPDRLRANDRGLRKLDYIVSDVLFARNRQDEVAVIGWNRIVVSLQQHGRSVEAVTNASQVGGSQVVSREIVDVRRQQRDNDSG